jgi:hypothetical protein
VGWGAETFQESDSENEQPRQRPKDVHPHTIVNATPAGTHSSVVNASTILPAPPESVPQAFEFTDTPFNDTHMTNNDDIYEMDLETVFQEYGFMDPELSAAWDEEHGLKAKRARTASVSDATTVLIYSSLTAL